MNHAVHQGSVNNTNMLRAHDTSQQRESTGSRASVGWTGKDCGNAFRHESTAGPGLLSPRLARTVFSSVGRPHHPSHPGDHPPKPTSADRAPGNDASAAQLRATSGLRSSVHGRASAPVRRWLTCSEANSSSWLADKQRKWRKRKQIC